MSTKPTVSDFLRELQALDGRPYIWGAKGPNSFDCSGAVTYALWKAGGPNLRPTHNAQRLADACRAVAQPNWKSGMCAFYGSSKDDVRHVMVVLADPGQPVAAYGACGGNQLCTTEEIAARLKAAVQRRNKVLYRPDLVLVGTLPWLDYGP